MSVRKASWTFIGQGAQSLQTLLVTVVVARTSSVSMFGEFGMGFLIMLLGRGVAGSLSTEPLLIRWSARTQDRIVAAGGGALAASLLVAVATGIATVGVLALTGERVWSFVLPFALACALSIYQDALRQVLFTMHRPEQAAAADLIYLVVQVVMGLGLWASGRMSASGIVWVWVVGALASIAAIWFLQRLSPVFSAARSWTRSNLDLGWRFLLDFLAGQGSAQLVAFGTAAIVGIDGVAGLRGAQTLTGPLTPLVAGCSYYVIPHAVVVRQTNPARLPRFVASASAFLCAAVLCWTVLLAVIPDSLGTALLGDSWGVAQEALPGTMGYMLMSGAGMGAMWGLRVLERAGAALRIRVVLGVGIVVAGLVGAHHAGVAGAAWGMAIGAAIVCPIWWVTFLRSPSGQEPAGDVGARG